METKKLVFVYNADSGLFNLVTDIAHKIFSPQTYACQLCNITHGTLQIHEEWKAFIEELPLTCEFLHRDEFLRMYTEIEHEFPAIYTLSKGALQLCVDAREINLCNDLLKLKSLIQSLCCS
jgi:hypothetical protein